MCSNRKKYIHGEIPHIDLLELRLLNLFLLQSMKTIWLTALNTLFRSRVITKMEHIWRSTFIIHKERTRRSSHRLKCMSGQGHVKSICFSSIKWHNYSTIICQAPQAQKHGYAQVIGAFTRNMTTSWLFKAKGLEFTLSKQNDIQKKADKLIFLNEMSSDLFEQEWAGSKCKGPAIAVVEELLWLPWPVHYFIIDTGDIQHQPHY